nr:PAS domain S-box protein [uncultured Pedobacter sp.]
MKEQDNKKQILIGHSQESDLDQQLRDYQNRIASILESFTDGFFEVDSQWIVTYWNKAAEKLLMRSREQVIGRNLWELYPEAIPLKFYSEYHRAVQNSISVRFEEYFSPKQLWIEAAAFPTGNGLSVYFKDITERKVVNELLHNEKQKYVELFNLSPLPQWVYDFESLKFLDVNEAAIHHYGYSREEFMAMTIKDIRPAEDVAILEKILDKTLNDGAFNASAVRHQKKDKTIIHVRAEGNAVGFEGKNARLVMVIDRTWEIAAQKALEDREQRFSSLVEHGSDMIAILDPEARYSYVTSTTKTVLGIDPKEFIGCNAFEFIHPEDQDLIADHYRSLASQDKVSLPPFRFMDGKGQYRWLETILTNMMDDPAVGGIVSNSRDITRRIENEMKTEESISRFNTVSKATSDAIWDWNILTGEIIWNQGIKEIFGYRKTSYNKQWWREHVHPDDLQGVLDKLNKLLKNQRTRLTVEYRFRCSDGSYRFVLDRAFLDFDSSGIPIRMIGSMQDITDRVDYTKAIEAQNARLQEISWIQSHKIRSPLASILGLVNLIGEEDVDLAKIKEMIPYLKRSAEKLDAILNEIIKKIK